MILGNVPPLLIAAAALGSVSPDIDHPGSFIGRRLLCIVYFAPYIVGGWLARSGREIAGLLLF